MVVHDQDPNGHQAGTGTGSKAGALAGWRASALLNGFGAIVTAIVLVIVAITKALEGAWIIILKGMTPIPYKLVTITSGFAGYNFGLFVLLSLITRGGRFFGEAFLLNRYGDAARRTIEKRLHFWVTVAAVVLVGGIIVALYII